MTTSQGSAYARATKRPRRPAWPIARPSDWLVWIDVRDTNFKRSIGSDLNGEQVNAVAGRRFTPNFLLGLLGGHEHFDYSSQA